MAKNKVGNEDGGSVLQGMVRGSLTEKVTFEERSKELKGERVPYRGTARAGT